ncbi:MAG: acyl-CoA dehydratase activase [Bacillota bacterium]
MANEQEIKPLISLGLDMGVFSAKGVLIKGGKVKKVQFPTAGKPVEAARKCIDKLLENESERIINLGIMGQNARLVAESLGINPVLEIEALQAGLVQQDIKTDYALSLGHENMHYLELDPEKQITYFSRNGQCAAGSGSFWYQQATRMGYNDRELASIAVEAESAVPISGRCAVFAKSDMTHAINEGATQSAVSAGMAQALVENVFTSVSQNRIKVPGRLVAVGGVANNQAVLKYLKEYAGRKKITVQVPDNHEFINAIGAAVKGTPVESENILNDKLVTPAYHPEYPLPSLDPNQVYYMNKKIELGEYDLTQIYLGVDCGSVSTKCVLTDRSGRQIGGVYLPTTGRPALQVLELMKQVENRFGELIGNAPIIACTTGSGRFLSQKILNADYAVDEITCQAEGIKHLFQDEETLSIIEIGGEDSKFIQLQNGILFDYNMNPVCAAGTGTFLENLAELLGIKIKEEFSEIAFSAQYAVDLGDICTLISQSILASASARGLPLEEQLASLAYSSAQNYLSKTVDKRPLNGKVIFAGATAKNHALASALAAICEKTVYVPPEPELTGALGSALMARQFHQLGREGDFIFRSLTHVRDFTNSKKTCRAECKHEHNCMLNIISFADGKKFIYGDRCGRYSNVEKKEDPYKLPDYSAVRAELMEQSANKEVGDGPSVGIARSGLYFEYFPLWSTFFHELGCRIVVSDPTTSDTLQKGKVMLDSEMCYPMKIIIGHYQELKELDPDYIFLPEVIDMEVLPWAEEWPRSFVCPLLQTLWGTVANSIELDSEKTLYARLNYRSGEAAVKEQLRKVAKKVLGSSFKERLLERSLQSAYRAQENFRNKMISAAQSMFEDLKKHPELAVVVFLSRGYTLYDEFMSKKSMLYARQSGLMAVPHEYFIYYLQAWFKGEIESPYLDPYKTEFKAYLQKQVAGLENIYPAQLQRMLSAVILLNFLNDKTNETGLPPMNLIFLDPFKCGPNAMMRHYLSGMTSYLRLTLDEHTAAAGMITRLEAFRNTCLSNRGYRKPVENFSKTRSIKQNNWNKILIPNATDHADIIASVFKRFGVEAEVLPRGNSGDLSLAQRFVNGEECLPFIQNLQDILSYLQSNGNPGDTGTVFFQGWACGPCRYGLYAPIQALTVDRAGYGQARICSIKYSDISKRFGFGFVIGLFNALVAMDILYKLLYRVRPYELEPGSAESIYSKYRQKLSALIETYDFKIFDLLNSSYRKPFEQMVEEASAEFALIAMSDIRKPRILLNGEFYVRIDDRTNQSVIEKIEKAGGEVNLAPATELLPYTLYIDYLEAKEAFKLHHRLSDYLKQVMYAFTLKLAHRDEVALEKAAGKLLEGLEEPPPEEIMERASRYVSKHYGGEPPMTIGRAAALAGRNNVDGAVFVAPFTCMPGSVVEAQQRPLQEELGIPIVTVYYDGKDNSSRDELVEGLVFQAKQKLKAKLQQ